MQRFCNEVLTWKFLRHPNVLPLLGVMMTDNQLTTVSEWMVNGNIDQFVKAHADADRLKLVCLSLKILALLVPDDHMITAAWRGREGVSLPP